MRGSQVSGSYFSVLGVSPSLGRLLTERDDQLPETSGGESCAAVISHQFWVRRFQQNADVLRRTLRVRDTMCAIVRRGLTRFHQPSGRIRTRCVAAVAAVDG